MIPRAWLLLAVVGLIGFAFWRGWVMGAAHEKGAQALAERVAQATQDQAEYQEARKEEARQAALLEAQTLNFAMEDAAHADPDDAACILPPGRVQRLKQR